MGMDVVGSCYGAIRLCCLLLVDWFGGSNQHHHIGVCQGSHHLCTLLDCCVLVTYPGVYIIKMVGISGPAASAAEQIGYSMSDVVAKAVFGVLIWAIAAAKSADEKDSLLA